MAGELVLIVEDNARNLKLARDVLSFHGYQTLEARTAEAGLEIAADRVPDLILMDLRLPGADGFAALERLRSNVETASIPVVALTAFAMPADRERCVAAGFDGYVEKPISVNAFPDEVASFLHGARHATETVAPRILVVDDAPASYRLLEAILTPHGYETIPATSGEEALQRLTSERMDLVLLDIMMPGIDGFDVCRRVRSDPATAMLPVIVVTGTASSEKLQAIEAGADDFIAKPVDKDELLARIKSLLRIKRYQDTIAAQATELELQKQVLEQRATQLAELNQTLDQRVRDQVGELDRLGRLKRFLSPQLAEMVASSGDASFLESHRREIAVVFCDLRDFTGFAETAEPEEVMGVLAEYHRALGELIHTFEGTLERFAGDGLMVFFNDPNPCEDAALRAVAMAVAMRDRVAELARGWRKRGDELEFGVGIAQGYATLGRIGFKERSDYAAIGTVSNLAARLCTRARGGQILISQRVHSATEDQIETEFAGDLDLKGFSKLVPAYNVIALNHAYQR